MVMALVFALYAMLVIAEVKTPQDNAYKLKMWTLKFESHFILTTY